MCHMTRLLLVLTIQINFHAEVSERAAFSNANERLFRLRNNDLRNVCSGRTLDFAKTLSFYYLVNGWAPSRTQIHWFVGDTRSVIPLRWRQNSFSYLSLLKRLR
jgi:hypothetical protein